MAECAQVLEKLQGYESVAALLVVFVCAAIAGLLIARTGVFNKRSPPPP